MERDEIERILALAEKSIEHFSSDAWYLPGAFFGLLPPCDQELIEALDPAAVKQLCETALRNTAQAQVTEAEVEAAYAVFIFSAPDATEYDRDCIRSALEAAARARGTGEERNPTGAFQTTHWEGCWKDKGHHACAVARLAACENATDEMTDSVRYLFVGMEKPGQTFGGIRQHCVWAGMDTSHWPKWMYGRDAAHFNKAARAALVWHIMRQTALAAQSSAKGVE